MAARRWWLCVPPVVFAIVDYVLTMSGQSAQYWAGNHDMADEENPLVRWMMTQHPFALHGLTLVWIAGFVFAILMLPRLLARAVSLSITFSHAFCAGTWLYPVPHGYYLSLGICISSAVLFVFAIEASREDPQAPK